MLQYGMVRPAKIQMLYGTGPVNTGMVALTAATMVMSLFVLGSLGKVVKRRRKRQG